MFNNYKRKVNNVATKIKKWRDDMGSYDEFKNDSDFIEHVQSPTSFSDSSGDSPLLESNDVMVKP